uniref:Uncharacterized protein n=1 Tax=Guillardia theta TaxID=55529 RepID=A0A7S4KUY5_GUITH|mmetsp:Transcript_31546/g.100903  ORF Transcript_31546/g.100903 Transcript_31546/m.100903 type:complete len:460 (+) Transcript_31546:213-1592(+)
MKTLLFSLMAARILSLCCCLVDLHVSGPGRIGLCSKLLSGGRVPSLRMSIRGGSTREHARKLLIRSKEDEGQGLSIAAVHFGSILAISYYFATRSADWRLKLVFKGLAYNCLILAFGQVMGNRLHVLGYPLFSLLSLPRFFISPLVCSMLASSVASVAEAQGLRMFAASWILQSAAMLIGGLSVYSIFWHVAFGASTILDSTWRSAGLVYYKLHPFPPSTAILLPPILLVSLAVSLGIKMLRKGSFALLAGSCSMVSGILGSQNFVVWSESPACLLLALSVYHCAEMSQREDPAASSLASKLWGFMTVFAGMLLPHLAWHVATLNGHGGPEEEEDARMSQDVGRGGAGMNIQIAANNLIVNNSPKSGSRTPASGSSYFPTSPMEQDDAASSSPPQMLETSSKKTSQSTIQRISLNSAARMNNFQGRRRPSDVPPRSMSSQEPSSGKLPSPFAKESESPS